MLDAVIVEPALDKRTNLREVARNFCTSVVVASSLKDGLERVRNCSNCDVIYISSRFDLDSAAQFLVSAKETEPGRDSANLLIGSRDEASESYIARLTLKGFDGMLLEPASVDTFRASAEVALRARNRKLDERKKKSIDVMVRTLAGQLDELALKHKLKQSSILCQDKFQRLCHEITALDLKSQENYFSSLVEQFIDRPTPANFEDCIAGSVRVVRKRLSS
jgi:CheY-like chemotaxis protein